MSSAVLPDRDTMLSELWDRQQISDVMLRFGRGLDLHDWDLYACTLADPFEVDFFDLTGRPPTTTTPEIWARFASACLERLLVMHQYSNSTSRWTETTRTASSTTCLVTGYRTWYEWRHVAPSLADFTVVMPAMSTRPPFPTRCRRSASSRWPCRESA